jgi:hypothetical protein
VQLARAQAEGHARHHAAVARPQTDAQIIEHDSVPPTAACTISGSTRGRGYGSAPRGRDCSNGRAPRSVDAQASPQGERQLRVKVQQRPHGAGADLRVPGRAAK